MGYNKCLWDELDYELFKRVAELNLSANWNLMAQHMVMNFLYSIRKLVEDALKDKQEKSNPLGEDSQIKEK